MASPRERAGGRVTVVPAGAELFIARSHQMQTGPWFAFAYSSNGKLAFSQRGAFPLARSRAGAAAQRERARGGRERGSALRSRSPKSAAPRRAA